MAGRGPAPADQKVRRNKPEPVEQLAEFDGDAPGLPASYRAEGDDLELEFLPETVEWYRAWAGSPMAGKFAATDWHRLRFVIAPLVDQFHRRPAKDLAAEIRLQETLLGATALDRQRLRWQLPSGEVERARKPRRTPAAADRRGRLSVVS